ncbi:hypothetical protein BUE80_DR011899 [Diplocarpon rosae]|nr:hypothetical protein BUE80_DR011899 [Diplocarpon rosae]
MLSSKKIKFYGSQVGGSYTTPHPYTGSPFALLQQDIMSAFQFILFLPSVVFPLTPLRSGPLCELYPSLANLYDMFLHGILIGMQVPFILSMPFWILLPVWWVVMGVMVFIGLNESICYLLNGKDMEVRSSPHFAEERGHEHEQWIFLNGVAVGRNWLQNNVDRLALTFGRPVLGVHNKTNGIVFDVLQCLIQRNFTYATQDVRDCYQIVKSTLYQPHLTKVIFILHSQGGIEGGLIIDWLLQEVPQDLLAKLEVYTFGNAANHFNNPHLHLLSQHAALRHPTVPATTKSTTTVHYHDHIVDPHAHPLLSLKNTNGATNGKGTTVIPPTTRSKTSRQESTSGKTIRYIEHYAHTSDFVARWGVLYFTTNFSLSPTAPRFMGRVFERAGQGHQMNQHYLDSMFPLKAAPPSAAPPRTLLSSLAFWRSASPRGGIGNSGFMGCDDDTSNEFMDSVLELGTDHDVAAQNDEREGLELSYLGTHGEPLDGAETEVLMRDMSPISPRTMKKFGMGLTPVEKEIGGRERGMAEDGGREARMRIRVKDLSRLWLYRNGRSPKVDETDAGIMRMATI